MTDAKDLGVEEGHKEPLEEITETELIRSSWFTPQTALEFGKKLATASWVGGGGNAAAYEALRAVLPFEDIVKIFEQATVLLKSEPTLVELSPEEGTSVMVVGDTHGQLHDVLNMLEKAGLPSDTRHFVFNGDFVDRGAWGLEVLLVFLAWKIACPKSITLLRGNHETVTCSSMYGFKGEVEQKYGKPQGKAVYTLCKRLFAYLPLSARVGPHTLVLHGGVFRKPLPPATGKNKRKRRPPPKDCALGSLQDLRASGKGGMDPNGRGSTVVATDVLWSDPVSTVGLQLNVSRGVGVVFGPDVTQEFLADNGLKLILRSHEGPDARFERDDMPDMQKGWTTDHQVPAGSLLTVFSAPDYPQFQAGDEDARYRNLAAVAVLRGPDWCKPEMLQYSAILPRPAATASYDYMEIPGSDEEIEIAGSEGSLASSMPSLSDLEDSAFNSDAGQEAAESGMSGFGQEPVVPEKVDARKLRRQSREDRAGGLPIAASATAEASVPPPQPQDIPAEAVAPMLDPSTVAVEPQQAAIVDPCPPPSSPPSDPMDIDASQTQATPTPQPKPPGDVAMGGGVMAPMETDPSSQAIPPGEGNGKSLSDRAHIEEGTPSGISAIPQSPEVMQALPGDGAGQEAPMDTDSTTATTNPGKGEVSEDGAHGESTPVGSEGHTPLGVRNGVVDSPLGEAVTPAGQTIVAPAQMHTGRELEQKAAHTLVVAGGVSQDTPEIAPLHIGNGSGTPQEGNENSAAVATADTEMSSQEAEGGKAKAAKKPARPGGAPPQSRLGNGGKAPAPWR